MSRPDDGATDFEFVSVSLISPRLFQSVELKNVTTDLDVYEHLDKPYLTGNLFVTDNAGALTGIDILGGETIDIRIRAHRPDAEEIYKRFYIDKITTQQKVNDNAEYIGFHLIEDIAYHANLHNVNRSYSGKCTDIITKVAWNYLDKDVHSSGTDKQSVKVIVPNMNPIETMTWIKNRATTIEGYPFYLYSSLVNDKLIFSDLGTLISQNPMNSDLPFMYGQGTARSNDRDKQRRTILEYTVKNTEDLFSLIGKGLVGAKYEYMDTTKNKIRRHHFDVTKDLMVPLVKRNVLFRDQGNVLYSPDYTYDGKSYNLMDSRVISRIGGSSAYDNVGTKFNTINETNSNAEYKLNAISKSMQEFLHKSPMEITLNGVDFIQGKNNHSVGNNIRLKFFGSVPDPGANDDQIDARKSGDYLIFSTQYMFKREKLQIRLKCVKLGNLRR